MCVCVSLYTVMCRMTAEVTKSVDFKHLLLYSVSLSVFLHFHSRKYCTWEVLHRCFWNWVDSNGSNLWMIQQKFSLFSKNTCKMVKMIDLHMLLSQMHPFTVSWTNFTVYCKINEAHRVFCYDFRYNTLDQAADHIIAGHIAMTEQGMTWHRSCKTWWWILF